MCFLLHRFHSHCTSIIVFGPGRRLFSEKSPTALQVLLCTGQQTHTDGIYQCLTFTLEIMREREQIFESKSVSYSSQLDTSANQIKGLSFKVRIKSNCMLVLFRLPPSGHSRCYVSYS